MNLHDVVIDRSPLQKSIRLETLRIELEAQGYQIVSTAWLRKLNDIILKKRLEEA